MRLHTYHECGKVVAKKDIKRGDIVTIIYKKFARPAKPSDHNYVGFSEENYKKGEEVLDIITFAENSIFTNIS